MLRSRTHRLSYSGSGSDYAHDSAFSAGAGDSNSVTTYWLNIFPRTKQIELIEEAFFVSSDKLPADVKPDLGKGGICKNCEFMKWGAWATKYTDGGKDNAVGGWWITGNIAKPDQLDALGQLPQQGSANYAGHAVGSVINNGQAYTASGQMDMSWNFQSRSGRFDVTEFDKTHANLSFGGPLCGAGLTCLRGSNHFVGALSGSGGPANVSNVGNVFGAASGSFVNSKNVQAHGVIGNWNVRNVPGTYQATGIFGGARKP